ncbi:MAG: hypothetical protein C0524_08850 [Rhodobacter sp.]|nr:hypothetical protein [Rhodobacter sp.]
MILETSEPWLRHVFPKVHPMSNRFPPLCSSDTRHATHGPAALPQRGNWRIGLPLGELPMILVAGLILAFA